MLIAEDRTSSDSENCSRSEPDGLIVFKFAGANLRARKIHQNRDGSSEFLCGSTGAFDVSSFLFVSAVRHVNADAVSAGGEQLFDNFRRTRSWAKSDNNLCSSQCL